MRRLLATALAAAVLALLTAVLLDRALSAPPPTRIDPIRVPSSVPPSIPPIEEAPRRRAVPQDAVPVQAPPAAAHLSGIVVDERGAPVSGAHVTVYEERTGLVHSRLTTASDGTFESAAPPTVAELITSHSGRIRVVSRWDSASYADPAQRVRIELLPSAQIRGRVMRHDSHSPVPGARVLAICATDGRAIPRDLSPLIRNATEADSRAIAAAADESGYFELDHLLPETRYRVIAGASGMAMTAEGGVAFIEAESGSSGVEIELTPLYLLDVRVRSHDGGELRPIPGADNLAYGITLYGIGASTSTYGASGTTALLAGVAAREAGRHEVRLLIPAVGHQDRLGPYTVTVRLPGYPIVQSSAWAHLVSAPEVGATEIRMPEALIPSGRLRLRVEEAHPGLLAELRESAKNCRTLRPPELLLQYEAHQEHADTVAAPISIPLSSTGEAGRIDVDGLPVGEYSIRVRDPTGGDLGSGIQPQVSVSASALPERVIRLGEWAGVRVRPSLSGSGAYDGAIRIELRRTSRRGVYTFRYSEPPYTLVGIPPGTYELTCTHSMLDFESVVVDLPSGRVIEIECSGGVRTSAASNER